MSVCMHIYVCVYVYICRQRADEEWSVYNGLYIYIYLDECEYVNTYAYMYKLTHTCVYMYTDKELMKSGRI